jgi:hypothetical protein
MTSTGLPANNEPGNEEAREPTGNELQFISVRDAKELWGDRIWAMEGMTWLFNDGQCECVNANRQALAYMYTQSSITTTISRPSSSLVFGEVIPRWERDSLLQVKPICQRPPEHGLFARLS